MVHEMSIAFLFFVEEDTFFVMLFFEMVLNIVFICYESTKENIMNILVSAIIKGIKKCLSFKRYTSKFYV